MITNKIASDTDQFDVENSFERWILEDGSYRNSSTHGIAEDANWHDNEIVLGGSILTNYMTNHYGIWSEGRNAVIDVEETGRIESRVGIYSTGDNVKIIINGEIDGYHDAVKVAGANSKVVNNGAISGEHDDTSNAAGVAIYNESRATFINRGTVEGGVSADADRLTLTFTRTSIIEGGLDVTSEAGDQTRTVNKGLIDEGNSNWGVYARNGDDVLINSGKIIGSVGLDEGNDRYDGRGGKVEGVVYGGTGNDTYIIASSNAQLGEFAGQGKDIIKSTASFTLNGLYEFEKLILTGNGNIDAHGNGFDSLVKGNGGNNRLSGAAGDDVLTGGLGVDVFLFRSGDGQDEITDFGKGDDRIDLSDLSGIGGFADLIDNHVSVAGNNLVISSGTDELKLRGVSKSDLDASDYLF
jgi:Ca2+-binding RTX toxin-like protein